MTKKTQMKLRKILTLVSCAVLLVCMTVVGTIAYLTSTTEVVNNTFTYGTVAIDLDEADVDEYGDVETETRVKENVYKLIPGHTYTKDPTIHVAAGSEESWLFVEFTNGISAIEAEGDTTIAAQMAANDWINIEGTNIFYYKNTVSTLDATEATDVVVFESFTVADNAEVDKYTQAAITIKAYAVQSDGFGGAVEAWNVAFGA